MSLMHMSLYGGILIIAIIIFRSVFIGKLPKNTFLVLWGIALARLLVPIAIPSSFSIYTLDEHTGIIRDVLYETPARNLYYLLENPRSDYWWLGLFPGDAQVGAIICSVCFLIVYLRCLWAFQTSLPVSNHFVDRWLMGYPLNRKITVRQSDRISSPLTYGFFRSVILMPKNTDWHNEEQLHYVFLHEWKHIQRNDLFIKLLMVIAVCLHWFNPLVWVMWILLNRDLELACDEWVILHSGLQSRSSYALALIALEEKRSRPALLSNHFSKTAIEQRIRAIMKTKKIALFMQGVAVALVLFVFLVFATTSSQSVTGTVVPEPTQAVEVGY